ncbi:MAG: hypothetical protein ACREEE_11735 [Dongiaceae bacterium]
MNMDEADLPFDREKPAVGRTARVERYVIGVLLVLGARHLPAVEITLISLIEVVLNPFWTWLGVGEVPAGRTLIGGMVVLSAIIGLTLSGARRNAALN